MSCSGREWGARWCLSYGRRGVTVRIRRRPLARARRAKRLLRPGIVWREGSHVVEPELGSIGYEAGRDAAGIFRCFGRSGCQTTGREVQRVDTPLTTPRFGGD